MEILMFIGLITVLYYLVYLICPWFLECDIQLAIQEKFGKPIDTLKGKVVWITGASSGIGEHLAYTLAKAGCKLILTARRENELNRVKASCLSINKNLQDADVEVCAFDICDYNLHEKMFSNVLSKFGKLDILVNNAGRSQRAIWENINLNVDRAMFELNVFAQISLSRIVGKYFLEVGQGHFVVNSSVAGIKAVPFSATYAATKHALKAYYESFEIEKMDTPIKVTVVYPGPVKTDFLQECFTEEVDKKYGQRAVAFDNKVSAERCATLMAVAIANENSSIWIAKPIPLQILYLTQYYPNLGKWVIKRLGARFFHRLRDVSSTIKQEQK